MLSSIQIKEKIEQESLIERKARIFKINTRRLGITFTAIVIVGFLIAQFILEGIYLTFTAILASFIAGLYIHQKEKKELIDVPKNLISIERFEWVDQFRGMVVIFLIIAAITWILSGGHILEIGDPNNPPIGPTYLNHGWKYAEFENWPDMITIIDIGQQILMFIVGYVGALAFYKHQEKEGTLRALLHVFRRFVALMMFAIIVEGELFEGEFDLTKWNVVSVFWTSTFPNLAWGSLFSLLLISILRRKPDIRCIIAIGIMTIHAILYSIPYLQSWQLNVNGWKIFEVPWNTINHIAIAIMGTCTYDWYMMRKENDDAFGWRKRILPISTLMIVGVWLLDFLQPAEHHNATTTLSLLAISTSMFVLFVFYSFDKLRFRLPMLSDFGKNILLMFLLTGLWDSYFSVITKDFLLQSRLFSMILVGIIPILTQYLFAWSLNKFRIIVKF